MKQLTLCMKRLTTQTNTRPLHLTVMFSFSPSIKFKTHTEPNINTMSEYIEESKVKKVSDEFLKAL